MENTPFHWRAGWFFTRIKDGDVVLKNADLKVAELIPAAEWCSIVAAMSHSGETGFSWETAMRFHTSPVPKV